MRFVHYGLILKTLCMPFDERHHVMGRLSALWVLTDALCAADVTGQDERENFFFVVDMHAITVPQDPKKLSEGVISAAATYLAAGIDPGKSKMFVQVQQLLA